MKQIPLTRGLFALVDDEDFDRLNAHNWIAHSSTKFYAARQIKGGYLYMHREIMNTPKGLSTDHINGNTLDNRRSNLRIATATENTRNSRSRRNGIPKGVHWHKQNKCWRAQIAIGKKAICLGCFDDMKTAGLARDAAAIKYQGDFAYLNYPEEACHLRRV